jgi:hypothetical protein
LLRQHLCFFPHGAIGARAMLGLGGIGLGEGIGRGDLAFRKLGSTRKIKLCQSLIFRTQGIRQPFAGNQ